jgi:NTP pyrophosphatase (non-canonical NTP hydrolase)
MDHHGGGNIVSGFAPTKQASIKDIMASLGRRGFLSYPNFFDPDAIQTQVDAVLEELGEVARMLRRSRQGREDLDIDKLSNEGSDVVIASVCLLAQIAGNLAPEVISIKLADDEKRGWLHSGMSREEYEAQR